jgi:uncharacterized protein YpmB
MKKKCMKNTFLILTIFSVAVLAFVYYYTVHVLNLERRKTEARAHHRQLFMLRNEPKADVCVYDLKRSLTDIVDESIRCRKSAELYVTTTLCLYDSEKDVVSKAIWKQGVWEEHILSNFNHPKTWYHAVPS